MEKFWQHIKENYRKYFVGRLFPCLVIFFKKLRRNGRRFLRVLVTTSINYSDKSGPEAAASLAYFSIFSLFPLLILLITLASFFVEESALKQVILKEVYSILPISQELISDNIERALRLRSTLGVIGLIALAWTSTNYFHILIKNINLAWDNAPHRSFIRIRLYAFAVVGVLGMLIVLSLLATTILNVLAKFQIPVKGDIAFYGSLLWKVISKISPFIMRFLVIWLLYIWIPATRVNRAAGFWGALFATTCWELFTSIFVWVLGHGLTRYELIYGSLATLLTLYVWIYQSSFFILYGAHLSAAVAIEMTEKETEK